MITSSTARKQEGINLEVTTRPGDATKTPHADGLTAPVCPEVELELTNCNGKDDLKLKPDEEGTLSPSSTTRPHNLLRLTHDIRHGIDGV